jgi:hypothetical protein
MPMSSTRSDFPPELLAGEPSVQRLPPRRRPLRFLFAVGIGVAATLAWQSYGDAAREMIANSYPQLGWLAPSAAAAQAAPTTIAAATASLDQQDLKAMSLNLAAVRQRVDQVAAQVAAGQEQMTRDFTAKLHAAEQDILDKISAPQPAAAPARKPVPPPSQAAPLR